MRRAIVLFALIGLLPMHAVAQEWKDAFDRRDFLRAQQLLQPIVFGGDPLQAQDALPSLYLASIYSSGSILPRDEVLACAIMFVGSARAAMYYRDNSHPLAVAAEVV